MTQGCETWNPSLAMVWTIIGVVMSPFVITGIILWILDKKDGLY